MNHPTRRPLRSLFTLLTVVFACLAGCNPVYAPPVRISQHGAPHPVARGTAELGGAIYGVNQPVGGAGVGAVAVTDRLGLELGFDSTSADFAMGHLGLRFTPKAAQLSNVALEALIDLEIGGGAGAGGETCEEPTADDDPDAFCAEDDRRWTERPAGGIYGGAGIGLRYRAVDVFYRLRLQGTVATDVPLTFWHSSFLGLQVRVLELLRIYSGAGFYSYRNKQDAFIVPYWEVGLSVFVGGTRE